jgi:ankyrin repeat protein
MIKLRTILLDALILFLVSTLFVAVADFAFSGLKKKIPKDDPVVTAIGQGEQKALENVLAEAPDRAKAANRADEHGRTSLMRAAYLNLAEVGKVAETDETRMHMAESLLINGASPTATDNDGWTALMWAAWSGLPKVADLLLQNGCPLDAADRQGNTALIIAARRGNVEVVQALLAKGADKTARNQAGLTALQAAELGLKEHSQQFYESRQEPYRRTIAALK